MITKLYWMQKRGTDWDFAHYCVVRPQANKGYACIHTFFLAAFQLDGTNDAEDLANVRTLCEIHYQHSLGDT